MAKKRIPFDPNGTEAQQVLELYKRGKAVSVIAKQFHRGYPTILKFLESKNVYRGIESKKKTALPKQIVVPEVHKKKQEYFSTRHNQIAVFYDYYNDTCRVFLPQEQYWAYTKKTELIQKEN